MVGAICTPYRGSATRAEQIFLWSSMLVRCLGSGLPICTVCVCACENACLSTLPTIQEKSYLINHCVWQSIYLNKKVNLIHYHYQHYIIIFIRYHIIISALVTLVLYLMIKCYEIRKKHNQKFPLGQPRCW